VTRLHGYAMTEVGAPLAKVDRQLPAPGPGEVLIEVAGCGVCHTDLGFLFDGVRTRHPMPLVLGHEISGRVISAGEGHHDLVGSAVVVPAVIPCGVCDDCTAGAPMICKRQIMPGNDSDGGFASHVIVPAQGLCIVPGVSGFDDVITDSSGAPNASGLTLRHLAVVADAVSTPYQAIARSGLSSGDVCVIIGLGGVGGYALQIALARGAKVVAMDVDTGKLDTARELGAHLVLDAREVSGRAARKRVRAFAGEVGAPSTRWTILECSGSAAGQSTAFDMLVHGATLMVVGFTMAKLELRLSNLMAFDARALGNWGCAPELYPDIVKMAVEGELQLVAQTEIRPLDTIQQAFDDVKHHRTGKRLVLIP
jgi:6-hydroxycyclohex-1-ene-1-carbonyl-CoA dehydrogenase